MGNFGLLIVYFCLFVNGLTEAQLWHEDRLLDVEDFTEEDGMVMAESMLMRGRPRVTVIGQLGEAYIPRGPEENNDEEVQETPSFNGLEKSTCACDTLSEKVDQLMSKLKEQNSKIEALENRNKLLIEKVDDVEQRTKVNNVIFTNVKESKNEGSKLTLHKVLQVLNGMMKLRVRDHDISVALRVNSNDTGVRPIVVTFNRFETKTKVLSAKKKLNRSNIDILADYSEMVNQRRKELLPFLQEMRSQGHKAFLFYDQLMVNGEKMSLEQLQAQKGGEGKTVTEEEQEDQNPTEECKNRVPETEIDQEPDDQVEYVDPHPEFHDSDYYYD